jgi:murein DD-endopeptidase MepM/ murein hydrolase activator NlpD
VPALAALILTTVAADEPAERRLRRFQREAEALVAESERLGGLESGILAGLAALTAARDVAAAEVESARQWLTRLEDRLDGMTAEAERASRQETAAGAALRDRVRALERRGPAASLMALAAAPDPRAALAALRAFSDRVQIDHLLVARARRLRVEAGRIRAALETEQRTAEDSRRDALEAQARADDAVKRHSQQLQAIREREELYRRAALEMQRAAQDLDDFLVGRRQASPAGPAPTLLRGTLAWPAPGQVLAGFGPLRHPRFGTLVPHNGIDIGAVAGTPVRAVADGTVVFADWFQGYGRTVIIDHGDGVMSVSAHLAEILAAAGGTVVAGETVGLVGDSGTLDGTRLYFELRQDGVPQEPLAWLATDAVPAP